MATHKAYLFEEPNKPMKETKLETPKPSTGQVLVEVLATIIMPYSSAGFAEGGFLSTAPRPLVPGLGGIGRVVEVGTPDSTSLEPGQLVFCNPSIHARDDVSGHTSIIQGWFPGLTPAARKLMEGEFQHGTWAEKAILPVENATPVDEEELI